MMVRFILHGYVCPKEGKVPLPWTHDIYVLTIVKEKCKNAWDARLAYLCREETKCWINNGSEKMIEVVVELYC